MAIDTGFIDAANNISKTYLGGVQPIADALDPAKQQDTINQRRLGNLIQAKNEAQAQGDVNTLQDAAKKRADIQNILQSSQSYDPQGNLVLDHDKFIAGVEAQYPEEAQNIRKNYLANDTAEAKLDDANAEGDEKTLQNILDLAVLGRDVPQARDFVINQAKASSPELGALLEQHKDNEDFWKGAASQSKKSLDIIKSKNDTTRLEQHATDQDLQRTRANQGQERLDQKRYDPATGLYTSINTALPYGQEPAQAVQPKAGSEAAQVKAMIGNLPANQEQSPQAVQSNLDGIDTQLASKNLTANQRAILQQERDSIVSGSQPQTQASSGAAIPQVRQSFVGVPKEEVKTDIKVLNEKKTAAEAARKNNEQLGEIRDQIKAGAYTGKAGVALSSALEYLPQSLVPDDVLAKVSAGQVLDKEAMTSMIGGLKSNFPGRVLQSEFDSWAKANVNRRLNDGAIDQLINIMQRNNNRVIKDGENAEKLYTSQGNLRGFTSQIATEQKAAETTKRAVQQGAPVAATAPSQAAGGVTVQRIQNKAQYDALPKGAKYIAPDGTTRTKGG